MMSSISENFQQKENGLSFFFFLHTYVHSPYGGCSQVLSIRLGGYMR